MASLDTAFNDLMKLVNNIFYAFVSFSKPSKLS